jgi:hypothetical protein
MSAAVVPVVPAVEYIEQPGDKARQLKQADLTPRWRGIGVLYSKDLGDRIELKVLYLKGTPADIKDIVVELFGVGALEWSGS